MSIETTTVETPVVEAKKTAPKAKAAPKPAKKAAKVVKEKKHAPKVEAASEKEREEAKTRELSIPHLRILKAMAKANKPMSYKDIEAKTGYYSTLTSLMRDGKEGSLCDRKFTKEEMHDVDGKDTLQFSLTAAGRKVITK